MITGYGTRRYRPAAPPGDIALCLSGGGFRAALFHLGAVRRLNELGVLQRVKTITAVSGGATIAAHLARTWGLWHGARVPAEVWEREISAPFRRFTSGNFSTRAVTVGWLPWNWGRNAGIEALARECERRELTRQTSDALPSRPDFIFCAADLVGAGPWVFRKSNPMPWRVSKAVAVSACYPVFFRPYARSRPVDIALVDGGVSDNRGLEPVWRTHGALLVSDGGDVVRPEAGHTFLWSLIRSAQLLADSFLETQKRWLVSNLAGGVRQGAYWGITSASSHYEDDLRPDPADLRTRGPGYSAALARDFISTIRTHYDAFSDGEAAVLENHGYLLADAAARRHLGLGGALLQVPHPGWLSEGKAREALRDSASGFIGRGGLKALFGPPVRNAQATASPRP